MEINPTSTPYSTTNEESWGQVLASIDRYPDTERWREYKDFLVPLIRAGIEAGYHHYFRAGGSVSDRIFSTVDRRLEDFTPSPARLTIRVGREQKFVALSHCNLHFFEPENLQFITAENALSIFTRYLADLWRETKPSEPLPACLEKALASESRRTEE